MGHARALLGLADEGTQAEVAAAALYSYPVPQSLSVTAPVPPACGRRTCMVWMSFVDVRRRG